MVDIVAHRLNVIFRPYIIVFHFYYNLSFSHTAAILDSNMVSIVIFSKYVDVKQIYMNTICQTYIITRHINRVFALYKVESIITEAFSELFRVHGGHLQ